MTRFDLPIVYAIAPDGSAIPLRVSQDGTLSVDTELPAAIAINDAISPANSPVVLGAGLVFNGTTWDRQRSAGSSTTPGFGRALSATGMGALFLFLNVSTTQVGPVVSLGTAYLNFVAQLTIVSGTLATINCSFEGSLNGSGWYPLATLTATANGSAISSNTIAFTFLRANLTVLTGVSPVISIYFAATP